MNLKSEFFFSTLSTEILWRKNVILSFVCPNIFSGFLDGKSTFLLKVRYIMKKIVTLYIGSKYTEYHPQICRPLSRPINTDTEDKTKVKSARQQVL